MQVLLVAPVQQPARLVQPAEPVSQAGLGFEKTTLEQADTTQGEGVEPEVAMETGIAVETVQEGEEKEDAGLQEREEGEHYLECTWLMW